MDFILYFKKLVQRIKQNVCTQNRLWYNTAESRANQNARKVLYMIIRPSLPRLNTAENFIFHCFGLRLIVKLMSYLLSLSLLSHSLHGLRTLCFLLFCVISEQFRHSFRIRLITHSADVSSEAYLWVHHLSPVRPIFFFFNF